MVKIKKYFNQPVKRHNASLYLLLTLLSFAASITLTRLFLELTGYPQIGNKELHIAHVLWGGIFLFVATLLLVTLSNRWVYSVGAIIGGIGVGLFIDEIGKFITQNNNYFYPMAAPIIYAFFLLTVMFYMQIKRNKEQDARTEMYHVLDILTEVLDHDLDNQERTDLLKHLQSASKLSDNPDLSRLSDILLNYIQSGDIHLAPKVPRFWERWIKRIHLFEEKVLNRSRFKAALISSMAVLGIWSFLKLITIINMRGSPDYLRARITELINTGQIRSQTGLLWLTSSMALEGLVGLFLLASSLLLTIGKDRLALFLSYYGLLIALTISNLLVFYYDQFSTINLALIQFIIFLGVIRYKKRFTIFQEHLQ
jgi:AcrR family transcriptional regulator